MTEARTLSEADVTAIADAVERRLRPERAPRRRVPLPVPTAEDRRKAARLLRRAGIGR